MRFLVFVESKAVFKNAQLRLLFLEKERFFYYIVNVQKILWFKASIRSKRK